MASPQKENGFTPIANELLEAIYQNNFSAMELRVILRVARTSYGWNQKEASAGSAADMAAGLRAARSSVHWATAGLVKNGVLVRDKMGGLSLNKNYDLWTIREKVSNPLDKTVQPIGQQLSNPLDSSYPYSKESILGTVQPIGQQKRRARSEKNQIPPSAEMVAEYCRERANGIDPQRFCDYNAARGWMIGKSRMKDWQAAVRTWERNQGERQGPKNDTSNLIG